MDWVWELYKKYITKALIAGGNTHPTEAELEAAFVKALAASSITILVQEPWMNSVRFKGLARAPLSEMTELLENPMEWLQQRYGGGKFKLNFHEGWHFVATKNFKPEGPHLWKDAAEISF